jgi:hypothetical protein
MEGDRRFPHIHSEEVGRMKKGNPWLMVFVAVLVIGLAQLACDDDPLPAAARGGGWIQSGEGKATFGFQLTCDQETGKVKGQFQYNDHAHRVAFHGVVKDEIENCEVDGTDPFYEGSYTPQPKKAGDPGTFRVELDGDNCLKVTLTGGVHDGYEHSGCLGGGHLNIWEWAD